MFFTFSSGSMKQGIIHIYIVTSTCTSSGFILFNKHRAHKIFGAVKIREPRKLYILRIFIHIDYRYCLGVSKGLMAQNSVNFVYRCTALGLKLNDSFA